jgi:hypothetical protein
MEVHPLALASRRMPRRLGQRTSTGEAMSDKIEFIDPNGDTMVPLRCPCGEQIGLKSPNSDMTNIVVRCYACAATEEAEAITKDAA